MVMVHTARAETWFFRVLIISSMTKSTMGVCMVLTSDKNTA